MSEDTTSRRRPPRRPTVGVISCPSCGRPVKVDSKWCPACSFSGADCMAMFPGEPPPLLPILDATGILTESDQVKITGACAALKKRFPQFQWRVCTVSLPPEANLSLFGFWLLNACPLDAKGTADDRAWTVLLLINSGTGQAAAVPGYAAEPFLSDDEWKSILSAMTSVWRQGKAGDAVIRFFTEMRNQLERAWKRFGARKHHEPNP